MQTLGNLCSFRHFDMWGYRRVKKNYVYQPVGGLLSLTLLIIISVLTYKEYRATKVIQTSSTFIVNEDLEKVSPKLQMNLDVTIPGLPCKFLTVHVQQKGHNDHEYHNIPYTGNFYKRSMNHAGKQTSEFRVSKPNGNRGYYYTQYLNLNDIKSLLSNMESCHFHGHLTFKAKNKARLVISGHTKYMKLLTEQTQEIFTLDFSHQINHLSFGSLQTLNAKKEEYPTISFTPLDNTIAQSNFTHSKTNNSFAYHVNILPMVYSDLLSRKSLIYQAAGEMHEIDPRLEKPGIFIEFEATPLGLEFASWKSFYLMAFITSIIYLGGMCMWFRQCYKGVSRFGNRVKPVAETED